MSSTDEKLDALLAAFENFKESQSRSHHSLEEKLRKFEEDLESTKESQEEATERALKRIKRDRPLQFQRKGHEEQYRFNADIQDHVASASRQLDKLAPPDKEKPIVEKAIKELQEGASSLSERQKHICFADQAENGWAAVAEYVGYSFADDDEDDRRMDSSDRAAGVKKRRKAALSGQRPKRPPAQRDYGYSRRYDDYSPPQRSYPEYPVSQGYGTPYNYQVPPPRMMPYRKQRGPCYQCGQPGHIRANCPNRHPPVKEYPLNHSCEDSVNDYVCGNDSQGVVNTVSVRSEGYHTRASRSCEVFNTNCVNEAEQGVVKDFKDNVTASLVGPLALHEEEEGDPLLIRCWEVEEGANQIEDVQGRLKSCLSFWEKELDPAPWILSCIRDGYKLPLRSVPDQFCKPNQQSALSNAAFVSEALSELENNRCIQQVDHQPHVCSPLSVVENGRGKLRLVINLRYLNQFLWQDKFKYEDLRIAMLMFQKGDFMFSFDLKSGYHHIDIYQPHRKFLGFQWVADGKPTFYIFNVLPFGLSTACYAFTKLLRPLVKYWRGKGLRALLYLDDGIVAIAGEEAAKLASQQVREDLAKAGLVEHSAKCIWEPTLKLKWLGFNLDLGVGQISVPEDKLSSLKTQLHLALDSTQIKAKSLASITGKIISMSIAMGPVTRLMTRSMYALLNTRQFWCQYLRITQPVQEEISFWLQRLDTFNGQGIWHTPSAVRMVYADASCTGYAGYTVEHSCYIAHGPWTPEEATRSSTWRELRAVRMVLESLKSKLKNERVRWFSDNQNVVRILQTSS